MPRSLEPTQVERRARPAVQAEKLALGVTLIVVGALLTLDLLDLVSVGRMQGLWPLFVVALGVARLATPGERRSGLLLLGAGCIFLASTMGLLRLRQAWPLFLVLGGLGMVLRAFEVRCDSDADPVAARSGRRA